ncbi:hypothetical protein ACN20G_14645 [Streptomyces sp. BI20]|uniref:hypothetical protein n=1 Tax=Streptomyces sp. BI20 TaxID=3403460 RepID=UPI003C766793
MTRPCGASTRFLTPAVLALVPPDTDHDARAACELVAGHPGEHADHVCYRVEDPPVFTSLWARWGEDPALMRPEENPECLSREDGSEAGGEVCTLWGGHPGPHSWVLPAGEGPEPRP